MNSNEKIKLILTEPISLFTNKYYNLLLSNIHSKVLKKIL